MKKTSSVVGQKSLLSFFTKVPASAVVKAAESEKIHHELVKTPMGGGDIGKMDSRVNEEMDLDEVVVKKRGRVLVDDDDAVDSKLNRAVKSKSIKYGDSDDEVWNDTDSDAMVDSDDDGDGDDNYDYDEEDEKRVKKSKDGKKAVKPTKSVVKTPTARGGTNSSVATDTSSMVFTPYSQSSGDNALPTPLSTQSKVNLTLPEGVYGPGTHQHNFWAFLKIENRMDKKMHKSDHPEYNRRTLHVPAWFLKDQTPAMVQWWEFKSENMDTILFFKVGKFYELFHTDADVGMSELDLIYMKGEKAHSGFPEISYGKFAAQLVAKGYRVARVEQTETPEMLKERNDSKGKGTKDKVVKREMCSIMSKGTRTYCHLDDISLVYNGDDMATSTSVLLSIKETVSAIADQEDVYTPEYGICCVNTVIGTVTLAQFQDDSQRSRLRTMMTKYMPTEVLLESGHYSPETHGVIKLLVPKASIESLKSGSEMLSPDVTIHMLQNGNYYLNKEEWPVIMKAVVDGYHDKSTSSVLMAVGGALWQLKRSLIDNEVFSLGKVMAYIPPDRSEVDEGHGNVLQSARDTVMSVTPSDEETGGVMGMTLDAAALQNLEILVNNFDKTEKGSLWMFVNRCKTSFGKRVLKDWLVHPLFRPCDIARRRVALEEIMTIFSSEMAEIGTVLKGLPDLERLLTRVHSNGLKKKVESREHPDTRAVMYENGVYNSRKIKVFADILNGFEKVVRVGEIIKNSNLVRESTSVLLQKLLLSPSATPAAGRFPFEELDKLIKYFRVIFDEKQAKKDGIIKPRPGIDPEYDQALSDIAKTTKELENHLSDMKRLTGIHVMTYFGSNKDRYQLEVPMGQVGRVPSDWYTTSQKKTHRRYRNKITESLFQSLKEAEERMADAQNDTMRRIFERFDQQRNLLTDAVYCIGHLDALISLATVSSAPNYNWPTIIQRTPDSGAILEIKGGRHPMLEDTLAQRGEGDYIPNSTMLGGVIRRSHRNHVEAEYNPKLLLLSGPNMGGKSTLLRQTCLITILAQLGCKVPADACNMTPVDRIFTRVGASDRILAGQSTFFVELAETATMLHAATEDSLGILDELGRGTATFDGTAIAHSVVNYLVTTIRCRTLFATHYHSLIDDWSMDPRVKLGHMDCMVANADTSNGNEEVTFLYRLSDGSSPRSYGINVARLAKLPEAVISLAIEQSRQFEDKMNCSTAENGAHHSTTTTRFFERLVSIAGVSKMPASELAYVAAELWRRWSSIAPR